MINFTSPHCIIEPPKWFLKTIQNIISTPIPTPLQVSLRFDLSDEAAIHNLAVLRRHSNDINAYINANKYSFLGYGSEFRPIHIIEPLLLHHRSWPSFSNQLKQG